MKRYLCLLLLACALFLGGKSPVSAFPSPSLSFVSLDMDGVREAGERNEKRGLFRRGRGGDAAKRKRKGAGAIWGGPFTYPGPRWNDPCENCRSTCEDGEASAACKRCRIRCGW